MGAHAFLAPSSAGTIVECPAMPSMVASVINPMPEDDTAAREGTAAHWAGAEMLHGRIVAEGQITPDGAILTEEMIEGAEVWVDDVRRTDGIGEVHIEKTLPGGALHPDNWGTPDTWKYDGPASILHVWDFKFGHDIVEVFENYQLLNYVKLILKKLGINGHQEQRTRVIMTVIQPRAYHREGPISRWSVMASDLRAYWNKLEMAFEDATSGHARAKPNPGCVYCPARHECPTLQRDGYRSADLAQEATPLALPAAAIGLELAWLTDAHARLGARISGLRAQAEAMVFRGERVPGWALQDAPGREEWSKSVAEVLALGKLVGLDIAKPTAAITPAQARKAGVPAPLVAAYSGRPKSSRSLVKSDDSDARKIFS